MSRRTSDAAESAAAQASEAARVLQARQQASKAEAASEPRADPKQESKAESHEPSSNDALRRVPRGNETRRQILEEIRGSRGEPKTETKEPEVEEPKKESGGEAPAPAPAAAAEPQATEAPPAPPIAPEQPKTVRVKVDGEEFDAPQEEVDAYGGVRPYQIAMANERRLRKTNEGLAEIKRMLAEGGQRPAQPSGPQQSDKEFIESKMDVVRFGTPAESAAAWLEIQQRTQPKALDAHAIIEQATSKIRHDDAVAKFDKEFSDVVTNPILLEAVVSIRAKRMAALPKGQPVDWETFYRTIGNQVRSAVPARQSQPAAAPQAATIGNPSPASDKEARKASITNLPSASARAEMPKEEKPETREESLNRMRKARGLPAH